MRAQGGRSLERRDAQIVSSVPILFLVLFLALAVVLLACTPARGPLPAQRQSGANGSPVAAQPGGQASMSAGASGGELSACPPSGSGGELTGAGATFPAPLYTRWFDDYARLCGVRINYQPIGSGGGIRQHTERTVNFGASDGIMTDQ